MPKVGSLGLDMMFRTCTVQVRKLITCAECFSSNVSEKLLVFTHTFSVPSGLYIHVLDNWRTLFFGA